MKKSNLPNVEFTYKIQNDEHLEYDIFFDEELIGLVYKSRSYDFKYKEITQSLIIDFFDEKAEADILLKKYNVTLDTIENIDFDTDDEAEQDFNFLCDFKYQYEYLLDLEIDSVKIYEHSGLRISYNGSYPFNTSWDTSTAFVVYDKQQIMKEFGYNDKQVINYVKEYVKNLDAYLSGEVYYYEIEKKEYCNCCGNYKSEIIDCAGGFFDYDQCEKEAIESVKYYTESQKKK